MSSHGSHTIQCVQNYAPHDTYNVGNAQMEMPTRPEDVRGTLQNVTMDISKPYPIVQPRGNEMCLAYEGRHFSRDFFAVQLGELQQGEEMVEPIPYKCCTGTYGAYWGVKQDLQNQRCASKPWGFRDDLYFKETTSPRVVESMSFARDGETIIRQ